MAAKTYPIKPPENIATAEKLPPSFFCYQAGGLADRPMQIRCPICREMTTTRVEYATGLFTWLNCLAFCCIPFVCFTIPCTWCCGCIPFCWRAFKDTEHYCTRCNAFIGIRKLI